MTERNRLYDQWHGFCRRCHDPRRKDYNKYGGRGIKVCPEWRGTNDKDGWNNDGFKTFSKWAMSHGWKEGMTIDRICNNRGYSPNNCRLITKKQQAYNRSTCRFITINGTTKTMEEWSKIYHIDPSAVVHRHDRGWTYEEAITIPIGKKRLSK